MAEEGGVTVCVRVRPLIERENTDLDEKGSILWESDECTISQLDGTKSFTFDRVFHSSDDTAEVYKGVAAPIIQSAVQGYNGTIFAYGQTASGKTYTMLGTKDSPGILPTAINDVFNSICRIPDREFLLRVSYMEIHNDTVQDLLCSNIRKKKPLVVREDISRNIFVEDLSEEVVVSPEQVLSWLQKGEKNRHYGETKMNERSSRSHTIFRMIIESKEKTDSSSYDGAVMVSHLNLVDLAGSERASQTGAEGIRLKEGCNINRSLSILGQVIKKLCDDQPGAYINYRDSKLTRILQNSLGGNAKTVIICTVTPASLEETLSTLQFASTAKNMKNSPIVNEVLNEDALLKRYRLEIEDLKRRLEEVSSQSQLAQILEEKNALQKEQQEKIRTLTEMLVTAPSFTSQEFKARKKRRVTWAPGAINQEGGECLLGNFPPKAKQFKISLPCLAEMEDSVSSEFSEYDDQWLTASAAIPEEEWIPGHEAGFIHKDFADSVMLCETLVDERDNAVTEQKALKVELKNLQLEKEQLACELRELKEKMSTYEFVALERETEKEQEMQLTHEISSLKAVITNAEVCNQELQEEVLSKDLLLKEQKNKIEALENHVSELRNLMRETKSESGEGDMSSHILNNSGGEMQKMKQSLSDAEAVALDAKRESSFLRSENIALKEKMDQLSNTYKQIEKDNECYRRQLDAGKTTYKKMQSDLQKELQYYLQENAKLASLLEGKVPNDLLSCMELERKILGLKDELNKALEENSTLRKEAAASLEAQSGPDSEILQKEVLEKSEMIASLTSEREMLLAQVSEKERQLCKAITALKSKEDFVNSEATCENDLAFQELKCHCDELGQKFLTASEENNQMKCQVDLLSEENLRLQATIHEVTQEIKEMQEKDLEQELGMREQLDEAHQKLSEMEQLKDQLKTWASKMEAEETEKLCLAQRLRESEVEMQALTRERDDLKQKEEAVRHERDQIKEDLQETVSVNIESQGELRNAQNSLMHCQKQIKELEEAIVERESVISSLKESLGVTIEEQKQQKSPSKIQELQTGNTEEDRLCMKEQLFQALEKLSEMEQLREQFRASESRIEAEVMERLALTKKLHEHEEAMKAIMQERDNLKDSVGSLQMERDLIKEETEAEIAQKLHEQEETMKDLILERDELRKKLDGLLLEKDRVKEHFEAEVAQKLHEQEEAMKDLILERDELRRKLDGLLLEKDRVKEHFEAEVAQKLHEQEEAMKALILERVELRRKLDGLLLEKDRVKEHFEAEVAQKLHEQEEAMKDLILERDELRKKLDGLLLEKDSIKEHFETEVAQKLHEQEEAMKALILERDELRKKLDGLLLEKDSVKEHFEAEVAQKLHEQEEAMKALILERDELRKKLDGLLLEKDSVKEHFEAEVAQKLHEQEEAMKDLILERDELRKKLDGLLLEKDHVKEHFEAEVAQKLHEQEEAMRALTQERDYLKDKRDALQVEKDLIKEEMQAAESMLQDRERVLEELLRLKEQLCEAQQKQSVMEQLGEDLKARESELEAEKLEKLEMAERLCSSEEETKSLTQERDGLKQKWETLQTERELLKKRLEAATSKLEEKSLNLKQLLESREEQSRKATEHLNEMEQLKSKMEATEKEKTELLQRLHSAVQDFRTVSQEKENLNTAVEALQTEKENMIKTIHRLGESVERTAANLEEKSLNLKQLLESREEQSRKAAEHLSEMEQLKSKMEAMEKEKTELLQRLHSAVQDFRTVSQEKENLNTVVEALQTEKENMIKTIHRLGESVERTTANNLELQEQLKRSNSYKERASEMTEEPEGRISDENSWEVLDQTTDRQKREALPESQSQLDTKQAEHCQEIEAALKASKEQTQELLLELKTLKEKQTCCAAANLALKEENYKLGNKLEATEGELKSLKLKIQELENALRESRRNFEVKERLAKMAMELKERVSRNEVTRLRAVLEEKENCLKSALTEQLTLKAKLDKGAEVNKDEIEDLKTQLAKADMARMKQSKYFDQEMANAKALAEHREEQLRKLKEELRRAQQEQDKTVIVSHKDHPQPSLPITCGGGSGIVQSTQLLVLKSEHAKLEKEHAHLKKKLEMMLKNELLLKEEIRKWKEQPLRRQQSTSEEQQLKSPRKTAPPSLSELPSSPCRERSLQQILSLDTPVPVSLNYPTFFDNSRLGDFKDTSSSGAQSTDTAAESTDKSFKQWLAGNDDVSKCKTQ